MQKEPKGKRTGALRRAKATTPGGGFGGRNGSKSDVKLQYIGDDPELPEYFRQCETERVVK